MEEQEFFDIKRFDSENGEESFIIKVFCPNFPGKMEDWICEKIDFMKN